MQSKCIILGAIHPEMVKSLIPYPNEFGLLESRVKNIFD